MKDEPDMICTEIKEIKKGNPDQVAALTAAYALNMCTVSVSQIVDYADPVILEQEYDAILNNLNIQNMPKKEPALLEILEKILDVITFFRIDKVERELVSKEYQFKMKNAVWNAVPNFGMVVAGGLTPAAMAISIASQVGIGYMNYRKTKAENTLEYERETWKLEKTAIEQLNALRRQLFDTAWKLSDTYDYQDEYRLTERQIEEYNQILMDPDAVRKYERLDVIKGNFLAYPPFWYHFGHTANDIAQQHGPSSKAHNEELYSKYKDKAKILFSVYDQLNYHELLRDDPITCACALEHIDLLDPSNEEDKQKMQQLLQTAEKYCGGECDVLQLCAFAHLRIGEQTSAISLLRRLVNSDYNTNFNAQILSRIYACNQIVNRDNAFRNDYALLSERLQNQRYLFPWPDDSESQEALESAYNATMLSVLNEKYFHCLKSFFEKYARKFNSLLPIWWDKSINDDYSEEIPVEYYDITESAFDRRIELAARAFFKEETAEQFRYQLRESNFWFSYTDLFDEMFAKICELSCMTDTDKLEKNLLEDIEDKHSIFISCIEKLYGYASANPVETFALEEYKILASISFFDFTESFIDETFWQAQCYLELLAEASDNAGETTILDVEQDLRRFCLSAGIDEPDVQIINSTDEAVPQKRRFSTVLLGDQVARLETRLAIKERMINEIGDSCDKILLDKTGKKVRLLKMGSPEFSSYISKNSLTKQKNWKNARSNESDMLAVLDERTSENIDLVFTTSGIIPVVQGKVRKFVSYASVSMAKLTDDKIGISGLRRRSLSESLTRLLLGGGPGLADMAVNAFKGDMYSSKWIDVVELAGLLTRLGKLPGEKSPSNDGAFCAPKIFDENWERWFIVDTNHAEVSIPNSTFLEE